MIPILRLLIEAQEDFVISSTRSVDTLIHNGNVHIINERGIETSPYFLPLMNKIKKDADAFIQRGGLSDLEYIHRESEYFGISNVIDKINNDEYEGLKMDVNAAYWNIARALFLSEDTYNYGLKHKKERLKALGALATRRMIKIYQGGQEKECYEETEITAQLYHYITKKLDKMMFDFINYCYDSVVGYWVDCFFIADTNEKLVQHIQSFFMKNGLTLSKENVIFDIKNGKNELIIVSKNKQKQNTTQYFMPKKNGRK